MTNKKTSNWVLAFIIGIIGSIVLKFIEWTFQTIYWTETTGIFNFYPIFILQTIPLLLISFLLVFLSYKFTKSLLAVAFVPAVWYVIKELSNFIVFKIPLYGIFDAIFIGIPIGLTIWLIVKKFE